MAGLYVTYSEGLDWLAALRLLEEPQGLT